MFYQKADIRAFIVCATVLMAVGLTGWIVRQCNTENDVVLSPSSLDSLQAYEARWRADSIARNDAKNPPRELFPFDPNHADSATLLRLGLHPWQIKNMMKYRRKGGRWRSPNDFARLYGLSSEDFQRLRPYVRISTEDLPKGGAYDADEHIYYGVPKGEIPTYEKVEKLSEGATVNANTADTTLLKQIPGIGSYYARKIVSYRERLGGFISTAQLSEIEGLPAGVSRWFVLEPTTAVKQIRINHSSFKELVRHPYLSYEQTKAVVNHIRSYGPLRSWRDLRLYKEFTDEDFRRLTPYFVFD